MGLIKTIFYLLIFYFVFKILGRLLMPLMRSGMRNNQGSQSGRAQDDSRGEGEVRIEYTKSQENKHKERQSEGEYVDFEELD